MHRFEETINLQYQVSQIRTNLMNTQELMCGGDMEIEKEGGGGGHGLPGGEF